MAINPSALYPDNTTNPSVNYPYGSARNVSVPGDDTGTQWDESILNDVWGFFQSLLIESGDSPNGAPDSANNKQYVDAIKSFSDNSSKIDHVKLYAPEFLQTVSDINNGEPVGFLRFVDPAKHAGIRAGTNADDLHAQLQDAAYSGASLVLLPSGRIINSSVVIIPNSVSIRGEYISTANTYNIGTTILHDGVDACFRSSGLQNSVPAAYSELSGFRVRKTSQGSAKAAIELLSGAFTNVHDIRVDTDNNSYNWKYGIVADQTEVVELRRIDVQGSTDPGVMTAAFFMTNGPEYTPGNLTNFTNGVSMHMCNANSADYAVLHDGGEGFKVLGGNYNGSHLATMRLAGLNSFSIDSAYMEGSSGIADILIEQTTSGAVSVGAGGGGTISNCRLASTTTNCIKFNNASIQSSGHMIYGNRLGSGRTGSAISTTLSDGIRGSFIGPNVNLGGAGKNFLDASIYDHNTVFVQSGPQLEEKANSFSPGGYLNFYGSGLRNNITKYNRITGDPYVVTIVDHHVLLSNNSGLDLNVTLPAGPDQDGRILTFTQILGSNNCFIGSGPVATLNAAGDTVTIVYDHNSTTWRILSAIGI